MGYNFLNAITGQWLRKPVLFTSGESVDRALTDVGKCCCRNGTGISD